MITLEPQKMYDRFIGREKAGNNPIQYISVNLHTGSSLIPYASDPKAALDNIFEELCRCIKEDQKIFLYGSLPKVPEKIEKQSDIDRDVKRIISLLTENLPEVKLLYENKNPSPNESEEVRITPETVYMPFTKQEMDEIKKMYSKRKDMKKYPNPFTYQPEIN